MKTDDLLAFDFLFMVDILDDCVLLIAHGD